jgi:DNA-binding GntR family transcriptional regulator
MPQPTLNEWLYRRIRQAIISGEMQPGTPLNENALAEQFSTSSTPVRETLARLHQEGFVVVQPRKGRFVRPFDRKTIDDLYGVRLILETRIAEQVVPLLDDDECSKLAATLTAAEEALLGGSVEEYQKLDRRFHIHLMSRLNNRIVTALLKDVWDRITWVRNVLTPTSKDLDAAIADHRQIINGILRRDGARVSKVLETHIERAHMAVMEAYEMAKMTKE